jgi:hypothetical protein
LSVGESLSIRPPLETAQIQIALPDGSQRTLPVDRNTVAFADTERPGIYKLEILDGANKVIQSAAFAVNLFAPTESEIAPRNSITLSGNIITPAAREEVGQREYWPWAALLALLILLIEWYVYQSRIQARTVLRPTLRRRQAG